MDISLSEARRKFSLSLPDELQELTHLTWEKFEKPQALKSEIVDQFPNLSKQSFLNLKKDSKLMHLPLKVGVLFSGGPAAGGHNVVAGLFLGLKKMNPKSQLIGFINGPSGVITNKFLPIDEALVDSYLNLGGFDMLGSSRTKIETEEQFISVSETVKKNQLDGLVIVGGDDSNTNAAILAEYFLANHLSCSVVGIPKTIDGDLRNEDIQIPFGFDSATKTYSEAIGNILKDTLSQKKYTFFIKVMGRSASHIALECALQTHPNLTLIGEEVLAKKLKLGDIVKQLAELIVNRAKVNKNYGVIVIPEGLIEFISEFKELISDLNLILAKNTEVFSDEEKISLIKEKLKGDSKKCFLILSPGIQKQLVLERDPHGNVQVSKIETEKLLIELVQHELKDKKGIKFSPQAIFLGYEGRACFPSSFDCHYAYALGFVAALLINGKATGYMACVQRLQEPVEKWEIKGIPLMSMMVFEERKGVLKPVIKKKLTNIEGKPFKEFEKMRKTFEISDQYQFPGPMQFFGPKKLTDSVPLTLLMESTKE